MHLLVIIHVLCWFKVETRTSQLELIMKGDIIRAKKLDSIEQAESMYPGDDDESQCCSSEQLGENWTSLQFSEAMSILRKFLIRKYSKCQNCGAINPRISKPTFGWFHVVNSLFFCCLKLFSEIIIAWRFKWYFLSMLVLVGYVVCFEWLTLLFFTPPPLLLLYTYVF